MYISTTFIVIIGILVLIVANNFYTQAKDKKEDINSLRTVLISKDKSIDSLKEQLNELKININVISDQKFNEFKNKELENLRKIISKEEHDKAFIELEYWKVCCEDDIKRNAIQRHHSSILGSVSEYIIPFHTNFPYNPKDIRFIGAPIDLIVFDGLDEKSDQINIIFLEVQTGRPYTSINHKKIIEAVQFKRIYCRSLNLSDLNEHSKKRFAV